MLGWAPTQSAVSIRTSLSALRTEKWLAPEKPEGARHSLRRGDGLGGIQGAWPPTADAGSLSASQKAAKRQPNETPTSIRHMLGLVSGSQGALPTSQASSGGLAHPPPSRTLRPGQRRRPSPREKATFLETEAIWGGEGQRLEQHWEPDTKPP